MASPEIRGFGHYSASRETFRIHLQQRARNKNSALIVAVRKEVLGLPGQPLFAEYPVTAVSPENECQDEESDGESRSQASVERSTFNGPDIPEAIATFGISHCDEG